MRSETEATRTAGRRWQAARTLARRFIAGRLSADIASELLPVAAGEDPDAEVPTIAVDNFMSLAELYPTLLANTQRKQRGTWYTPSELAEPTVARTLGPLVDRLRAGKPDQALRICDPATGGGTFLVAALRYLQQAGIETRRAALWLQGVDIDSTAAALSALAVHEACGDAAPDPMVIAANIRPGDGLLNQGGLQGDTFDAVLTNPPWETLQSTADARERVTQLRPQFHHQGSGKLYTYRLFLERTHQLLRTGGRFGLILPASLWFDRDAKALRQLLLQQCNWEWLFGFENRKKLFAIDSRYRFGVVIGEKGGQTSSIKTAFGRIDSAEWSTAEPQHVVYDIQKLRSLSPQHCTFVECESQTDLAILERMMANGRPLAGPDGAFSWRQGDFNMTSDREKFVLRSEAEARGFRRGGDGIWRDGGDGTDLMPLYQGAMVYDLHPNTGAHQSGVGHKTAWEQPSRHDELRPQYLVQARPWLVTAQERSPARIVLRALSNATNERTAIACLLPDVPCGNSLGVLTPLEPTEWPLRAMAAGAAVLGSLAFDWALRRRLTGTNLNGFVLADCMVPRLDSRVEAELASIALRLCAVLPWHGALWRLAEAEGWSDGAISPAVTRDQRHELFERLDALTGVAFGLTPDDVGWIVNDTGPRGFRRVDRDLPPALRRPMRWLSRSTDGPAGSSPATDKYRSARSDTRSRY